MTIELNANYWDCECKKDYIKPKKVTKCNKCNAIQEEQPDSRQDEINKYVIDCYMYVEAEDQEPMSYEDAMMELDQ